MLKNTALSASVAVVFAATLAAQQPCETLMKLALAHTTVTSAAIVAGTAEIPAHCDVKATARPTSDSEINFELWLPPNNWNGKYQQVGSGGSSGAIGASGATGTSGSAGTSSTVLALVESAITSANVDVYTGVSDHIIRRFDLAKQDVLDLAWAQRGISSHGQSRGSEQRNVRAARVGQARGHDRLVPVQIVKNITSREAAVGRSQ